MFYRRAPDRVTTMVTTRPRDARAPIPRIRGSGGSCGHERWIPANDVGIQIARAAGRVGRKIALPVPRHHVQCSRSVRPVVDPSGRRLSPTAVAMDPKGFT